jgi:K+-sensing histidine kinase KdpD
MFDFHREAESLDQRELEVIYAISQVVSSIDDSDIILDEIVQLTRDVFIFDNIVIYKKNNDENLSPIFVRAIGRGRYREADLSWGEMSALEAFNTQETVTHVEELEGSNDDRTQIRHSIGLPLKFRNETLGALVFIRFGGPLFTRNHKNLAEFIAVHVSQLLSHRELVRQVAELEAKRQLDRLQDDFIATISHELLTPLGCIKGYATTLLREDVEWDQKNQREFLKIIDDETDRLSNLLDNLLDSSRLQAGTLQLSHQPIRVDTLIRDISVLAKSRNDQLSIKYKNNTPKLQIHADPTRLVQVLENIIGNAIKYAPGSPIIICTDQVEDNIIISIQDFGPGILSEHIDRVFERFYRVPGNNKAISGTGLGLYICQKIVQAHHGTLELKSTVGEGTTFFIYLPIKEVKGNY